MVGRRACPQPATARASPPLCSSRGDGGRAARAREGQRSAVVAVQGVAVGRVRIPRLAPFVIKFNFENFFTPRSEWAHPGHIF